MRAFAGLVMLSCLGCGSQHRTPAVARPVPNVGATVAPVPVAPARPTVPLEPSSRRLEEHASEHATTRGWKMFPLVTWRSARSEALLFWSATTDANTQLIVRQRRADGSWGEPDGPYPSGVRRDLIDELIDRDGATVEGRIEGAPPEELGPRIVAALAALREAADQNDGVATAAALRAVGDLYCLDGIVAGSVIVLLHPVVLQGARARLQRREQSGGRELFWFELASGRERTVSPLPARPVQGAPDRWSLCAP